MASHVSTCMEHGIAIKRSSQPAHRGGEQQRGKEKRKGGKERKGNEKEREKRNKRKENENEKKERKRKEDGGFFLSLLAF